MELTKIQALEAFAEMYDTFSVEPIAGILAEDFCFCSQMSFVDVTSRELYLALVSENLETVKASESPLWTRIGYWNDEPCLAMVQPEGDFETTRFVKVKGDKVTRLDMCLMPGPGELSYR